MLCVYVCVCVCVFLTRNLHVSLCVFIALCLLAIHTSYFNPLVLISSTSSFSIIRQEFKNRARSLEYLSGIITDLYVDWHRLHGIDSRRKIGELQKKIMTSTEDFDGLISAFFDSPHDSNHSYR